jgi:hypothetical protein
VAAPPLFIPGSAPVNITCFSLNTGQSLGDRHVRQSTYVNCPEQRSEVTVTFPDRHGDCRDTLPTGAPTLDAPDISPMYLTEKILTSRVVMENVR